MNTRLRMTPITSALVNPLNLFVIGSSVIAGLIAAWWLFPIGFIIWIVMVIFSSNDPALKLNTTIEERAPVAYRFQRSFSRIQKTEVKLFNSLSGVSNEIRSSLQPARDSLKETIETIHRVSLDMSGIENQLSYLKSNTDYEVEIYRLKDKIEKSADEKLKAEYSENLLLVEKQVAKNDNTATLLDRYEAQLSTIASSLEGAVTDILRLKNLPNYKIREEIKQLCGIINSTQNELNEFKEVSRKSINVR